MADEDFVFDGHSFADKCMRGNFAAPPDASVLLNLDERSDLGLVANLAAVKIYEVVNDDIAPKFDVGRDDTELAGHELFSEPDFDFGDLTPGWSPHPLRPQVHPPSCSSSICNSRNIR